MRRLRRVNELAFRRW